jgi:cyclopropane fatty-acyl-phospholipid synthase-like methyltransferase
MTVFNIDNNCQPNARGYDSLMYWPPLQEYFCQSDYVNYGYWQKETVDAKEAAENLIEKLLSFLPEKTGKILDVACGKGATTRYLCKYYHPSQVTGINISETQIATCRENAPECIFLLMDAVDLQFPDAFFDNIICVEAAFHFQTRQDFFAEALRVLKPGGRLCLSDILLTREAEERRKFRFAENYVQDLAQYEHLLRQAGFADCHIEDASVPCFHGSYWHLVEFSHAKLLQRQMNRESLRNFVKRVYEFVPEIRYYLLASAVKGK